MLPAAAAGIPNIDLERVDEGKPPSKTYALRRSVRHATISHSSGTNYKADHLSFQDKLLTCERFIWTMGTTIICVGTGDIWLCQSIMPNLVLCFTCVPCVLPPARV